MRLCNQFFYPHLPNTHQYTGVIWIDPSRTLLVAVSKMPLSHGADLCSCLFFSKFCTLSISFSYVRYLWSLVSGSAFACSWLIMFKPTLPRWQVASVLSVLFIVYKPRLLLHVFCWVHPKLFMLCSFCLLCLPLGLHTLTSLFWRWSEYVQRQSWNHVFHTHVYYVQPGQMDTQLNALPPNDQMWSLIMLTPKYTRSMVCTGGG